MRYTARVIAGIAQLVEQLICNQQVIGSSPIAGSLQGRSSGQSMTANHSHLDALENQSVFILREANQGFKNMAMPWSMGKDSNVLLWLALKAFFGQIPFPLLHIDTTYEFPEMLEFRDWAAAQYGSG